MMPFTKNQESVYRLFSEAGNPLIRISDFARKNNSLKISASFSYKSTSFQNLLKKSKIAPKNLYFLKNREILQ